MCRIRFQAPADAARLLAGHERGAKPGIRVQDHAVEVRMHLDAAPRQFHGDHDLVLGTTPHQGDFPDTGIAPAPAFFLGQPTDELE